MKEHHNRCRVIINCIRENKLKLSPENFEFRKSHVTNEGHEITLEGIQPDPEKMFAVKELPAPRNVSKLQTFLGFIQYQCDRSSPPRILLRMDSCLHKDKQQEKSFNTQHLSGRDLI